MIAIPDRNYDEVARLHADAGMISHKVPLHLFSQNIRAVIEPLLGKMLGDVSLGQIMGQILRISKRFDIEVQPQFTLLQKTIVMAEGVARQLNPKADMWELSRPLAAEWVQSQTNPEKLIKDASTQIMRFATLLPKRLDKLEEQDKNQSHKRLSQNAQTSPLSRQALPLLAFCGFYIIISYNNSQNTIYFHKFCSLFSSFCEIGYFL